MNETPTTGKRNAVEATCKHCGERIYQRSDGVWHTVLVLWNGTNNCPREADMAHDGHEPIEGQVPEVFGVRPQRVVCKNTVRWA